MLPDVANVFNNFFITNNYYLIFCVKWCYKIDYIYRTKILQLYLYVIYFKT